MAVGKKYMVVEDVLQRSDEAHDRESAEGLFEVDLLNF